MTIENEIKKWLEDYEEITGMAYGDEDTLEGSAYILFNRALKELKTFKKGFNIMMEWFDWIPDGEDKEKVDKQLKRLGL